MKQIRIGKDISLRWEITTDGEAMPLEGRDLTVELKSPIGKVSNMPFRVDGNVLIMTYYGYEQTHYGEYSLTLWENRGKPGQNVVDAIRAFKLVRTSQEEEDFIGGDLQVECVDLGTANLDILLGSTTSGDSPDLSALKRKVDANTTRISLVEDKNTEQDERINAAQETATAASTAAQEAKTAADNANNLATEAQSTAAAAQTKNTEQDLRLNNIDELIVGSTDKLPHSTFDGFTDKPNNSIKFTTPKDTYTYKILYSTVKKSDETPYGFGLYVTDSNTGFVGFYNDWVQIGDIPSMDDFLSPGLFKLVDENGVRYYDFVSNEENIVIGLEETNALILLVNLFVVTGNVFQNIEESINIVYQNVKALQTKVSELEARIAVLEAK